MNRKRFHNRKGFTLAETLLTVAILLVLFALAVPNLIQMRRNLRQKELDSKAEIIYIAVQNQLSKLRAGGFAELYNVPGAGWLLPLEDPRITVDDEGNDIEVAPLYYFVPGNVVANAVMTDGTVDDALLNAHWVVEYEPASGAVFAVFYSEDTVIESALEYRSRGDHYNRLRGRDYRLQNGAHVGYYDGRLGNTSGESSSSLQPTISISNGETLTARLMCNAPAGTNDLVFELTILDSEGHSYPLTIRSTDLPSANITYTQKGRSHMVDLTLDSLARADTRFAALYSNLTPGSNLTLRLRVKSQNNHLVQPGTAVSETFNSLFANSSTETQAHISFGRHLQNLDSSSGVTDSITAAVQLNDVSFVNDTNDSDASDWYSLYCASGASFFNGRDSAFPAARFKPIENPNLLSYDGSYEGVSHRIVGLHVNENADRSAGLFSSLGSTNGTVTVSHVNLTGSYVRGGSVGALAGSVTGGTVIEDCHVWLDRSDFNSRNDSYVWLTGNTHAGGLIGAAESGTLQIRDSFAATVAKGDAAVGGLVGAVSGGTLQIEHSYADCYLTSDSGGAAGLVGAGPVALISDSYAAGFQSARSYNAGLAGGTVTRAECSYTICAMEPGSGTVIYSTAPAVGTAQQLYYFTGSSDSITDYGTAIGGRSSAWLQGQLGSAFQTETNDTLPYNLRNNGLTQYTFPRLVGANMRHCGDWQAEFKQGSLVYYERYSINGTVRYGFGSGANVQSTLSGDGTVTGDGYGLVFRSTDALPQSIRVDFGGSSYNLALDRYYTVYGDDGGQYRIFPLPTAINDSNPDDTFYQRIDIVSSASSGGAETSSTEVYYFNPHFAETAIRSSATSERPVLEAGAQILVRTPRHLYDLSRYYGNWDEQTSSCIYSQGRNLDYALYDWTGFTAHAAINQQEPIGAYTPFLASYDGNCYTITNVSFVSAAAYYIGLFGRNAGSLRNIAVVTNFDADHPERHFLVKRVRNMTLNETVFMGVLAGYNEGSINNCAVAGYYIAGSDGTLHAYANSTLHVGGLVGGNAGVIRNCSADCPAIRLSSLYAEVGLAGFVGLNQATGVVNNCYSIGHLEVADSRGGEVRAAGFTARNEGRISASYCAVSIITSGETAYSYAFAPPGGSVDSASCFYLDKGTYAYVGTLRAYLKSQFASSGSSATYSDLEDAGLSAQAGVFRSFYHPNTNGGQPTAYPFRAVVTNRDGRYVHYGDWQDHSRLGTLGIFYWEHEEGGSNDGYHLTFIGTDEGNADAGTTLCTAHDDGGVITEFGYGFYVQEGQESRVELSIDGIAVSYVSMSNPVINEVAADALHEQLERYLFYPFTTRTEVPDGDANRSYIYLDNRGANDANLATASCRHGRITLTFSGDEGPVSYTYELTPFFANAMRRAGIAGIEVTASDQRVSDYAQLPGTENNVYEVRSVDQLRYINWNAVTQDCVTAVTWDNHRHFPYLQYAIGNTLADANVEKSQTAENCSGPNSPRPVESWIQTHDLNGQSVTDYRPIAAMTTTTVSGTNASSYAYAWFGGRYDGQSYKIQNLDIISDSYTVGLFGLTVGAKIQSIILHGDGESIVARRTDMAYQGIGTREGAYTIGGLVGTAYDFNARSSTTVITNCAISGYRILDQSGNQHYRGGGCIGGLFGACNVSLENCSAVTDILIDSYRPSHPDYGSYLRVGGIAGATLHTISNCYSGGRIDVADHVRYEKPTKTSGKIDEKFCTHVYVGGISASAYIVTIQNLIPANSDPDGSGAFTNCYSYTTIPEIGGTVRAVSLIASQGDRYRTKTRIDMVNCYYLSGIAPAADYIPENSGVNPWCYKNDPEDPDEVPTQYRISDLSHLMTRDEYYDMLHGRLDCLSQMINNGSTHAVDEVTVNNVKRPTIIGRPDARTYAQLSSPEMITTLNNGTDVWDAVTTVEPSGALINGKYSFSSYSDQYGQDYPFPTVITQADNTYGVQVHVHYGAWPRSGFYWNNGRDTMDIFADMIMPGETDTWPTDGPWAEKDFILNYIGDDSPVVLGEPYTQEAYPDGPPDAYFLTINPSEDVAEILSVVPDSAGRYHVRIRALKAGSAVITVGKWSYATDAEGNTLLDSEDQPIPIFTAHASFDLNITANLTLSRGEGTPETLLLYSNTARDVSFLAEASQVNEDGNYYDHSTSGTHSFHDFTLHGSWTLGAADSSDEGAFEILTSAEDPTLSLNAFRVTSTEPGDVALTAAFTYDYHGVSYRETLFLPTHAPGEIGLSTGTVHSVVNRQAAGHAPVVAGAQDVTPSRALTGMPVGPELYLFGSKADGDLIQFRMQSLTVKPEGGSEIELIGQFSTGDYTLDYFAYSAEDLCTGEYYTFLPVSLRYRGEAPSPAVTVKAELFDPESSVHYTLSVKLNSVPCYTVRFDPNWGETPGSGIMYDVGVDAGEYTLPACGFKREGYHFASWTVTVPTHDEEPETTVSLQPGDSCTISGDTTFTATWEANRYEIQYNLNGGSGTAPEPIEAVFGEECTLSDRTDFTAPSLAQMFDGWNTHADGSGQSYNPGETVLNLTALDRSDPDYEPVVLYAQWVRRPILTLSPDQTFISYLLEGGSELPGYEAPSFPGWKLDGWYTATDGSGVRVLNGYGEIDLALDAEYQVIDAEGITSGGVFAMTQDRTLYPRWTRNLYVPVPALGPIGDDPNPSNNSAGVHSDYNVYNGDYLIVSGNAPGEQYAMASAPVTGTASTSRPGYSIVTVLEGQEIYFDEEGNVISTYIVNAPLKALWHVEYKYTQKLKAQNDSTQLRTEQHYANTFLFTNAADGYVLCREQNNPKNPYLASSDRIGSIGDNLSQWTYGQKMIDSLMSRNWLDNTTTDRFYWNDARFEWLREDGRKNDPVCVYLYRDADVFSFSPVLDPDTCYVDFHANGGTGRIDDLILSTGDSVVLPGREGLNTPSGYNNFLCWNTRPDGSGESYFNGDTITVTGNLTLYAIWGKNSTKATVTYSTGTTVTNVSLGRYTLLPYSGTVPVGYHFVGWYEDRGDGSVGRVYPAGSDFPVLGDVTFSPLFEENRYSLIFEANGGEGEMTGLTDVAYSDTRTLPGCGYTRAGYAFTGWNTVQNPDAETPGTALAVGDPTANLAAEHGATVTLYAQWVPVYTVSFDANGGEGGMDDASLQAGETLPSCSFTREGYNFTGWNTVAIPDAENPGTAYANEAEIPASFAEAGSSVTLYAQWESISTSTYQIVFDANGGTGTTSVDVVSGEDYVLPSEGFSNGDLHLVGWSTDTDGFGPNYACGDSFQNPFNGSDVVLYAMWSNEDVGSPCTIWFYTNSDAGNVTVEGYSIGDSFTLPDTETLLTVYGVSPPSGAVGGLTEWYVQGQDGQRTLSPGETIILKSDTGLSAGWLWYQP